MLTGYKRCYVSKACALNSSRFPSAVPTMRFNEIPLSAGYATTILLVSSRASQVLGYDNSTPTPACVYVAHSSWSPPLGASRLRTRSMLIAIGLSGGGSADGPLNIFVCRSFSGTFWTSQSSGFRGIRPLGFFETTGCLNLPYLWRTETLSTLYTWYLLEHSSVSEEFILSHQVSESFDGRSRWDIDHINGNPHSRLYPYLLFRFDNPKDW